MFMVNAHGHQGRFDQVVCPRKHESEVWCQTRMILYAKVSLERLTLAIKLNIVLCVAQEVGFIFRIMGLAREVSSNYTKHECTIVRFIPPCFTKAIYISNSCQSEHH